MLQENYSVEQFVSCSDICKARAHARRSGKYFDPNAYLPLGTETIWSFAFLGSINFSVFLNVRGRPQS